VHGDPLQQGPNYATLGLQNLMAGTNEFQRWWVHTTWNTGHDIIRAGCTMKLQTTEKVTYIHLEVRGEGVDQLTERGNSSANTITTTIRDFTMEMFGKSMELNMSGVHASGKLFAEHVTAHIQKIYSQLIDNATKLTYEAILEHGMHYGPAVLRTRNLNSRLTMAERHERARDLEVDDVFCINQRTDHTGGNAIKAMVQLVRTNAVFTPSSVGGSKHGIVFAVPIGTKSFSELTRMDTTVVTKIQRTDTKFSQMQTPFEAREIDGVIVGEHIPPAISGNPTTSLNMMAKSFLSGEAMIGILYPIPMPLIKNETVSHRFADLTNRINRTITATRKDDGDKVVLNANITYSTLDGNVLKEHKMTEADKSFDCPVGAGLVYVRNLHLATQHAIMLDRCNESGDVDPSIVMASGYPDVQEMSDPMSYQKLIQLRTHQGTHVTNKTKCVVFPNYTCDGILNNGGQIHTTPSGGKNDRTTNEDITVYNGYLLVTEAELAHITENKCVDILNNTNLRTFKALSSVMTENTMPGLAYIGNVEVLNTAAHEWEMYTTNRGHLKELDSAAFAHKLTFTPY
jgi:hypothetical protein